MKRTPLKRGKPLKRSALKRGRPKSKRAKENGRYEAEIRRRSREWAREQGYTLSLFGWHVDHVVPISYGKRHRGVCTVERMCSADNLRVIDASTNIDKGIRLTPAARELIDRWKNEYVNNGNERRASSEEAE